jgi:acyl-coenzyme A synthetase/AMP-(fatty) acid ligase
MATTLTASHVVRSSRPEPEIPEAHELGRPEVAPYERIHRVELVDELPKSPTGKLLRRVLRERERA